TLPSPGTLRRDLGTAPWKSYRTSLLACARNAGRALKRAQHASTSLRVLQSPFFRPLRLRAASFIVKRFGDAIATVGRPRDGFRGFRSPVGRAAPGGGRQRRRQTLGALLPPPRRPGPQTAAGRPAPARRRRGRCPQRLPQSVRRAGTG